METMIPFERYREMHRTRHGALFEAIKDAIADGTLAGGTKLPSSRELAAAFDLSRGTVNLAYDMLAAEGYVEAEVGRGTFVRFDRPATAANDERCADLPLSVWGKRVGAMPEYASAAHTGGTAIRFVLGLPDTRHFPRELWYRALYAAVRDAHEQTRREAFVAEGHLPLREAIARHLRAARGISADPAHIAVVNGSMQAIAVLASLLVDPGDPVVVEEPCFSGIRHAVAAAGGQLRPVPVDAQGIQPGDWAARLAFVTPSRQFPTGAVLPLERRLQLLAWASRRGAIVVEDDYDSEFRHRGRPIEPLKALDREGRVAYVGSFSKTLHPDLRLGYAVLPPALAGPFMKAKRLYEPHPSAIVQQRALASFMNAGHYERHLRRMKRVYGRKFELLACELDAKLGHLFAVAPSDAGLHLFGRWKRTPADYTAFLNACVQEGVGWSEGGSSHAAAGREGELPPSILLGFSHLTEAEIREGVERMATAALSAFGG